MSVKIIGMIGHISIVLSDFIYWPDLDLYATQKKFRHFLLNV